MKSFLLYLEHEKRYSKHTLAAYQRDLEQLAFFLSQYHDNQDLPTAQYYQLRDFLVSLLDQDLSKTTINRKLATLKSFYKYLLRQGEISKNPTLRLKPLKKDKKLPHFVKVDEMNQLIDQFSPDSFPDLRDLLVIELFYQTGIRLSELIYLKTTAFNFHQGHLKVLGKRNKERIIPFGRPLAALARTYLDRRNSEFGSIPHPYFIVKDDGKPAYPMFIYRKVNRYLKSFAHVDKKSPHVLRHTFATHLLDRGAELNAVKDLLGHTSLAATQVYTHNTLGKLKSVFDQAHPKA